MRNSIALLTLVLLITSSCSFMGGRRVRGNGILSSQQRAITDFSGVSVTGDMDVVLIPGNNYGVKVEADENLLPLIRTERDGDVLVISPERGHNLRPNAGMKIYVTAPVFNEVEVTGSGTVTSQSRLRANNRLVTEVTGSGDVKLDVDAPEVAVTITGSGNVTMGGNTRKLNGEINGSGDINGFNLLSENTDVEISGSGNARVFASKQLGIEINGSGNVDYKGNPPGINQEINGSGRVTKVQ